MTVSVVLRLLPAALRDGRLVGHAEVVETGETFAFKNLEEVRTFLRDRARQGGGQPGVRARRGR